MKLLMDLWAGGALSRAFFAFRDWLADKSSLQHAYATMAPSMKLSTKMRQPQRRFPSKLVLIGVGICILWFACVWRTQSFIELLSENSILMDQVMGHASTTTTTATDKSTKRRFDPKNFAKGRNKQKQNGVQPKKNGGGALKQSPPKNSTVNRYIVFRPIGQGQGQGNIVNGLMAAHALADEFDRIVCSPKYHDFNAAFVPIDPHVIEACKKLPQNDTSSEIRLINYEHAPDECELQRRLASDEVIVKIVGNTYPRWRPVEDKYLIKHYAPRPELIEFLPKPMPKTVVHLRQGDRGLDRREGLDERSLEALGKALPSDTFLVTNNLTFYDYFSEKYSWRHPDWHAVYHSASKSFMWDKRGEPSEKEASPKNQNLQMWSDWYVMAMAENVWHTHSDFSLSAIHWMGVQSKTLMGVDGTGNLKLKDEPWRTDEVMLPLKDRGPNDVKNCKGEELEKTKARFGAVM